MKNKFYFTLLLYLFFNAPFTFAQQGKTSIEVGTFSKYIWRDAVNDFLVIQPSIDYSFPNSNLNANLWLSINADAYSTAVETATTLYYNWDIKKTIELNAGLVHYSGYDSTLSFFDLPIHNWMELYTSFTAYNTFLSPSVEVYYHNMTGAYTTLVLENTLQWKKISLNTSLLTGARFASQFNDNGWREIGISLGLPFRIKKTEYEISLTHVQFPTLHTNRTFLGFNISLP